MIRNLSNKFSFLIEKAIDNVDERNVDPKDWLENYDPAIVVPTHIVYYDAVRKGKTKDDVPIGLRGVDVSVGQAQLAKKQENSQGGREDWLMIISPSDWINTAT